MCVWLIVVLDKLPVCDLTYRKQHFLTAQTCSCKLEKSKACPNVFWTIIAFSMLWVDTMLDYLKQIPKDHQGVEKISHESKCSQGSQEQCEDPVNSPVA